MKGADVFFVEHSDRVNVYLRRYRRGTADDCARGSYCNASVFFCEAPAVRSRGGTYQPIDENFGPPKDDPRWPTACTACGIPFAADDPFQLFQDAIMVAPATGQRWPFRELPPGACYDAYWDRDRVGDDGRNLVVILPTGHPWHIDARASNCTMKFDDTHRCWVRHGRPEDGTLHVDKNGKTCAAGAGSIAVDGYHGFLHNGKLTDG